MPKLKLKKILVGDDSLQYDESPPAHRPSFYTHDKQMKEIAGWEQGKVYRIVVDVEMSNKNESDRGVNGSFDIVAYKHLPDKTIEEMSDEEFGEYQGEALAKM